MKNGIYKVEFKTQLGSGTGVIVVSENSAKGGDSLMYYTGTLEKVADNKIDIKIHVKKHSNVANMTSTLGLDDAHLILSGTSFGETATFHGRVEENPSVSFEAHLTFLG